MYDLDILKKKYLLDFDSIVSSKIVSDDIYIKFKDEYHTRTEMILEELDVLLQRFNILNNCKKRYECVTRYTFVCNTEKENLKYQIKKKIEKQNACLANFVSYIKKL